MDGPATIILNPTAGAGRAARRWRRLAILLQAFPEPPRVLTTEGPGHAVELASGAVREGTPLLVAAGGDGTAHECVQGMLSEVGGGRCATRLGYVPLGTGCDFALALGLPRDPAGVLGSLPEGRDRAIDIGVAEVSTDGSTTTRYFLNAANVGVGPAVALRVASSPWLRRWGKPAYLLAAALSLLRTRPQHVSWRVDGAAELGDATQVGAGLLLNLSACNGPSFGGGMRPCPDARLDSGRLHVALVGPLGLLAALRQMPKLMRGQRIDHPHVRFFSCERLQLEGTSLVEADGEVDGTLPASLRVRPAALIVRLPK